MFIAGHAGLTLGLVSLISRGKTLDSYREIAGVIGFALLPDVLDKGLHIIFREYPDHAMFHSLLLYAMVLPLVYLVFRRYLSYVSVMALNVLFDLLNVDHRVFAYPLFGWQVSLKLPENPYILEHFMKLWPEAMRYKYPFGHYLIFELCGLLAFAVVLVMVMARNIRTTPDLAEPPVNFARDIYGGNL